MLETGLYSGNLCKTLILLWKKEKKNAKGAGIKMILLSTHLKKGRIILDVPMPSIIHWKKSHLLCICKYTQVHDYALS